MERSIGRAAHVRFRVESVAGRPILTECRITADPAVAPDGLDAGLLRAAVATRDVLDTAEPLLASDVVRAWDLSLSSLANPGSDRDTGLTLAAIGYAAAIDAGSRRPVLDVADAMGIPRRRVQRWIELARDLGILGRPTESTPIRGHWRGVVGGRLTPMGNELFDRVVADRLGVDPDRFLGCRISGAPRSAARLLAFLSEPVSGTGTAAGLVIDGADARMVSVDEFYGRTRRASDGSGIRYTNI